MFESQKTQQLIVEFSSSSALHFKFYFFKFCIYICISYFNLFQDITQSEYDLE